ncbi:MAG: sigma-70 family RNA polymerase sigma factor [Planctomycetes bacterium]|nr:sigma-70 family RNA polymerase sigma factor [Planctomycetota bacterium]
MDSDRELVAAVLAGERDRFEPLVARHGPALAAWIERKLADREEAREVFQETWVRAFEGLAELRDAERLRAWLISIAHNVLRQRFRRARFAPANLSDEFDADLGQCIGDDVSTPGSALERDESATRARSALARLSERQREIFLLRVEQELSHAEIAALLSIREDNSRAHFHLAVRALRRELGEDE